MDDPDPGPSLLSVAASEPALSRVDVEVVRRDGRWPSDDSSTHRLSRVAVAAFHAGAPRDARGELGVVLAGDKDVRALNARWRGKNRPTNVLSFPLEMPQPGATHGRAAGDVVLAYETVAREARQKGIPLLDHAAHLIVHGVLHILGYDHEEDRQAEAMERLESRILTGLGIADPYRADEDART